jgi:SAM-dependent methyltransferase
MRREPEYVIRGGEAGYERLELLARTRWADTAALFARAGLSPGMDCVDVGCGGGHVTLELARLVGPAGSVVGIDMDGIKLDLARGAAAEQRLANVDFRQLKVGDWAESGCYDAVFCRFLLQHLSDPVDVLRRMWVAARPDGVVIAEDADFDGWCCHPANEGFDFFVRTYREVISQRGGDQAYGRKLYAGFLAAGIPGAEIRVVQPVWTEGEGKTLPWSTLEATADAIVAEGIAAEDEVMAALDNLWRFTVDPRTLISGPRVFQLWARR